MLSRPRGVKGASPASARRLPPREVAAVDFAPMSPSPRRNQGHEWAFALLVGGLLLVLSDLLVPPATAPFPGHGERFAGMVADPFAFAGPFPQRVLWPLLAHAAGWFGIGPVASSRLCSGALLVVVCWFVRGRGAALGDAVLLTAAVAATGAVQVYKPMVCMTADTLNLLLLLLTLHHVDRPRVFWGLVALATFSHEMVLFFGPWLWWQRLQHGGSWWRDGLWLAACGAVHGGWRYSMRAAYDASYYAQNNFWVPWGLPALWLLFLLVVLAEFGPLLVAAVWGLCRGEHGLGGRLGPWLYAATLLLLLVFAYDVMRFASFVVLPVLLAGGAMLRQPRGRAVAVALVAAAVASYLWAHPVASEQGGRAFTEVSGAVLPLLPPSVFAGQRLSAGEGLDFLLALLRVAPGLWAWTAAAAAGVLVGGVLLARYAVPGPAKPKGGVPATTTKASP